MKKYLKIISKRELSKMEQWKKVCLYVSVYAVLREFRPIDPFVIQYLSLLPQKYTVLTIREMYPVGSYCSVVFVIIIFLVTDYLRYKPIMILNGFAGMAAYILLLGAPSMTNLKISQIFKTLFRAADVAYYTYMFANITNKDQYRIATSRVSTSVLIGKFSCGLLAQIFISFHPNNNAYTYLLYLSILGMLLTTIWSFILPPAAFSLYFYKEKDPVLNVNDFKKDDFVRTKYFENMYGDLNQSVIETKFIKLKCFEVVKKLWEDFKIAYSDATVLKWSAWWSLSLCGYILVANYIQLQWQEISLHEENAVLMNGAVESLGTIFSAAASFAVGKVHCGWEKYGELIMAIVAISQGVMLSFFAQTESLMSSYVCYIVFCCSYQTMLTISSSEVAKFLKRDCYGLVFGFNKFVANVLITIFTVVVVDDTFFSFDIRKQYFIYGMYFVFMGCLFIVLMVSTCLKKLCRNFVPN